MKLFSMNLFVAELWGKRVTYNFRRNWIPCTVIRQRTLFLSSHAAYLVGTKHAFTYKFSACSFKAMPWKIGILIFFIKKKVRLSSTYAFGLCNVTRGNANVIDPRPLFTYHMALYAYQTQNWFLLMTVVFFNFYFNLSAWLAICTIANSIRVTICAIIALPKKKFLVFF